MVLLRGGVNISCNSTLVCNLRHIRKISFSNAFTKEFFDRDLEFAHSLICLLERNFGIAFNLPRHV